MPSVTCQVEQNYSRRADIGNEIACTGAELWLETGQTVRLVWLGPLDEAPGNRGCPRRSDVCVTCQVSHAKLSKINLGEQILVTRFPSTGAQLWLETGQTVRLVWLGPF
jgi:hypothetical protein